MDKRVVAVASRPLKKLTFKDERTLGKHLSREAVRIGSPEQAHRLKRLALDRVVSVSDAPDTSVH